MPDLGEDQKTAFETMFVTIITLFHFLLQNSIAYALQFMRARARESVRA